METEQVRMWRSDHEDRVLLMEGRRAQYVVEPRDEESVLPADVAFPEPVVCDPGLIASFHQLQTAFACALRLPVSTDAGCPGSAPA